MMTQTNMKQIGWMILLLTALLVGVGGCTTTYQPPQGVESTFEIDGVQYSVAWYECTDSQKQIASSFLIVNRGTKLIVLSEYHSNSSGDKGIWTMYSPNIESTTAKPETLYFVQDLKIVFEKDYSALGIDASRLKADQDVILDYLRPLLEKLIREHVQPQEPEREEQTTALEGQGT